MSTIRESITLDPISSDRMDTAGKIHRYNFGWIKTHKIVGGPQPGGVLVESAKTGISGMEQVYDEYTAQSILPASLEVPTVSSNTEMASPRVSLNTFFRRGTKYRTLVRSKAIGVSTIITLGSQNFAIEEKKVYADAVGSGGGDAPPDDPTPQAADGGITITVANGVETTTTIKG
jgi:hypothetical protein